MLDFRNFLERYMNKDREKYIIRDDKTVYAVNYKEGKRIEREIARKFFDIHNIILPVNEGYTYKFVIIYEWVNVEESSERIDYVCYSEKNKRYTSELLGNMGKDAEYDKEFIEICQKYVKHCINNFLHTYRKTNYIGWKKTGENKKYLGLFRQGKTLGYQYPKLFNDEISSNKWCFINDTIKGMDFSGLLDIICGNEVLLGIFAYTVHSLFYYYGGGNKSDSTRNIVFSICIHGRKVQKVFEIANIFSNLFEYNENNFQKLKNGSFISCSSIERNHAMYYRIESATILIKHKNNRISKNTGIVRTYQRRRIQGEIAFFPVYVSQCPINADEILDFCVDDIFIGNDLAKVKKQVNCILALFICFLEDLQGNRFENMHCEYDMDILYPLTLGDLRTYQNYDLDSIEEVSKALLYIACKGFSTFLEHMLERPDIAQKLENQSKAYFMDNEPVSTERPYADGVKSFLLFINSILDKEERERPFLCVKLSESRGGEECVYIDYKKGFEKYKAYCRQSQIGCLEYNSLLKHLKQNKLLKMRTNRAQYFMKRTIEFRGEKQKQFLLVILYDAFEQLLDDA